MVKRGPEDKLFVHTGRERLPTLVGELCRDITRGDGPCVVCRNVQKSYGGREILKGIDLTVNAGEVVVIMGPSGSGKSTLLRMINHLEPMDWGEITVDSQLVGYERAPDGTPRPARNLARARAAARIGMVFQHFNLLEHLTALENVTEAPVRVYRRDAGEARATAARLLGAVGLGRHTMHLPHRLSGGQQQRVAIARALAVSARNGKFPLRALWANSVMGSQRAAPHGIPAVSSVMALFQILLLSP